MDTDKRTANCCYRNTNQSWGWANTDVHIAAASVLSTMFGKGMPPVRLVCPMHAPRRPPATLAKHTACQVPQAFASSDIYLTFPTVPPWKWPHLSLLPRLQV